MSQALTGYRGMPKRPLGQILVEGEFISSSDLETALQRQRSSNELLGKILVEMGVLDQADLNAVLAIQADLISVQSAVRIAGGVRDLLGNLLTRAKRITHVQLDRALAEQKRTGEKLGAVMVRLGMAEPAEIEALLAFQQNQSSDRPSPAPLRLGEILVAAEFITREQLDHSLRKQKLTKKRLGEVLIEEGFAQPHQISHGLRIQQKLLSAVLVALLSLTCVAGADAAGAASKTSSGKLLVSATVLPRASVNVLAQPADLVITHDAVRRGAVEVTVPTHIEVRNNSSAGYLLVFEVRGMPCKEVHVRGLGTDIRIGSSGGWIPLPYRAGASTMNLTFSFVLTDDAKPGTYDWPLFISARPL